MKTKRCKMKQGCCSVTFCPLVPSWATTIHKFQGFEAGFDKNDQFQHLIINPGDIKTEQQQPGILYVAMSRAKTMGNMTNDTPNSRNSAVYWTGCGMSKNRVLHGSTKKQIHTQGQERVNCLKIEKRENWVNYLTEQCKNTSSQQYNKRRLKKIKKKIKPSITGEEMYTDVLQSITNIIIHPSKQWKKLRSIDYLTTQSYFHLKKYMKYRNKISGKKYVFFEIKYLFFGTYFSKS